MGKIEEAIGMIKKTLRVSSRYQWSVFDLIWAYSHMNDQKAMQELIDELDARAINEYISPFIRGLAAAWSGDLDLAFKYIEKSYTDHEPMLLTIKTWPNVPDNLKNDPRCRELLKKINFPA